MAYIAPFDAMQRRFAQRCIRQPVDEITYKSNQSTSAHRRGIGPLKITDIRAHHLNDFYKQLSENGVRNKGAIATAKEVVKKKLKHFRCPSAQSSRKLDSLRVR